MGIRKIGMIFLRIWLLGGGEVPEVPGGRRGRNDSWFEFVYTMVWAFGNCVNLHCVVLLFGIGIEMGLYGCERSICRLRGGHIPTHIEFFQSLDLFRIFLHKFISCLAMKVT